MEFNVKHMLTLNAFAYKTLYICIIHTYTHALRNGKTEKEVEDAACRETTDWFIQKFRYYNLFTNFEKRICG